MTEGLVVIFDGAPGVGKTTVIDSVAFKRGSVVRWDGLSPRDYPQVPRRDFFDITVTEEARTFTELARCGVEVLVDRWVVVDLVMQKVHKEAIEGTIERLSDQFRDVRKLVVLVTADSGVILERLCQRKRPGDEKLAKDVEQLGDTVNDRWVLAAFKAATLLNAELLVVDNSRNDNGDEAANRVWQWISG